MIRQEQGRAITHIRNGINMFAEHRNKLMLQDKSPTIPNSMVPLDQLEATLRRTEIQLCELSMTRYPPAPLPRRTLVGRVQLPKQRPEEFVGFETIEEAREELDGCWHSLMFMLHELMEPDVFITDLTPADYEASAQIFHDTFVSWSASFKHLVDKLDARPFPHTPKERKGLAVLEMHQTLGLQILETFMDRDEMIWDYYSNRFNRLMDMCDIIAGADEIEPGQEPDAAFQLDIGIVAPCFHVIWKCRNARVRDRAIRLLEKYPRQDGLWNGGLVARVGRYLDETERGTETLADAAMRGAEAEEIPDWARIVGVNVVFSPEGKGAVISFMKQKSEHDAEVILIAKFFE